MKRIYFLIVLGLLSLNGLSAHPKYLNGLDSGGSLFYGIAAGSVHDYQAGKMGIDLQAFYEIPVSIPETFPLRNIGVLTDFGIGGAVGKSSVVDKWFIADFFVGAFTDLEINSMWTIRPNLSYGFIFNNVKAPKRNVDGMYADQVLRIGGTALFEPDFMVKYNLAFTGGLTYSLFTEKKNVGHYFDISFGAVYRFKEAK